MLSTININDDDDDNDDTLPNIVLNMSLIFCRWSLLRVVRMSMIAFSSVPGELHHTTLLEHDGKQTVLSMAEDCC